MKAASWVRGACKADLQASRLHREPVQTWANDMEICVMQGFAKGLKRSTKFLVVCRKRHAMVQ